jgi:hypothetical protein
MRIVRRRISTNACFNCAIHAFRFQRRVRRVVQLASEARSRAAIVVSLLLSPEGRPAVNYLSGRFVSIADFSMGTDIATGRWSVASVPSRCLLPWISVLPLAALFGFSVPAFAQMVPVLGYTSDP